MSARDDRLISKQMPKLSIVLKSKSALKVIFPDTCGILLLYCKDIIAFRKRFNLIHLMQFVRRVRNAIGILIGIKLLQENKLLYKSDIRSCWIDKLLLLLFWFCSEFQFIQQEIILFFKDSYLYCNHIVYFKNDSKLWLK